MKHWVEQYDLSLSWDDIPKLAEWVIEQGIAVQQIPAPTFAERPRAEYVADQFRALGLVDVSIDDLFNVYGRIPGKNPAALAVMISAHTDTIFAADTDLTVRRDANTISAPGIGDNSIGVSGMLGFARYVQQSSLTPLCDIWCVASTREEGLGDLGGMRAAFEMLHARTGLVLNLEGLAFGHVYHAGIVVRRLRVTAAGSGGHSWLHFGRPSAVHAIAELSARITTLPVSANPRTTFNIGMISGGEAINAIATHAELWLDMRSEDRHALERLERAVRAHIDALRASPYYHGEIMFTVEVVGDRPGGSLDPKHPLVEAALHALDRVDVRGALEKGSTDANIPLSHDCPAVTIGITRGANAHRLDEYIEIEPVAQGMRQLITLTFAAAHYLAQSSAANSAASHPSQASANSVQ